MVLPKKRRNSMDKVKKSKKKKEKFSCEELLTMEAVDIYKILLSKKISRFPMGFGETLETLIMLLNV